MIFAIINSPLFPCSRNHLFHARKLGSGFSQLGYRVIEINKIESVIDLQANDLIYISNHFAEEFHLKPFRNLLSKKLLKILFKTKAKILFWALHTVPNYENYLSIDNLYPTGESFLLKSEINSNDDLKKVNSEKYIPLRFGSPINPIFGKKNIYYERIYSCNYVGSRYSLDYVEFLKKCELNTFVHVYPPICDEVKRINSYFLSKSSLCMFSKLHKKRGAFTERLPEALSAGCIVLHNSKKLNLKKIDQSVLRYFSNKNELYKQLLEIESYSRLDILSLIELSFNLYIENRLSYKDISSDLIDVMFKN